MKQPNWKTPLILSASLLVVGTFSYWLQYSHKPKKEKADLQTKKPIHLASDDVQIALFKVKSSKGLVEVRCNSFAEKTCSPSKQGKWTLAYPKSPSGEEYPADESSVKEFLTMATSLVATEIIDLEDETPEKRKSLLEEYGLSDSQRTQLETQFFEVILADDKGAPGKRLTLWFGTEHPIGDKTFAASATDGTVNSRTIFLVSNQQKNSTFVKIPTDFRVKTVLSFDRKAVSEFMASVTAEKNYGGKLNAKKVNGLWSINGLSASYDRIETVLSGMANAKAIDFTTEDSIRGLKPVVDYQMKAGEETLKLTLFEKTAEGSKKYFAKSSTQKEIMEVDPLIRTNTDKTVNDLRDPAWFKETEKVTATHFKIVFKNFKDSPEFLYKNGKWTPKEVSTNWDSSLPQKILDQLALSKIKEFKSPAPTGSELFRLSIGDDSKPAKFNYSMIQVKDQWYALNLNEKNNEAYLIEDSLKYAFPKTEDEWKIKKTKP